MKSAPVTMKFHRLRKAAVIVLRPLVSPFIKRAMNYECGKDKGPEGPCIVVANHNADLDPALVLLGFTGHMYFVASEHALRGGFAAKLLKWVFSPIPISKTNTDTSATKEILRRLKRGANVCVFAEGNRSYNGITGNIEPSIAKLIKISGAALITYHMEGGYFTSPRWSSKKRKGRIRGRIAGRYSPLELKSMDVSRILAIIEKDIYENAYERQRNENIRFKGKGLAENIETALYLCPKCGGVGSIRSHGDRFYCACGLEGEYQETGFMDGKGLPFDNVADWYGWQASKLPVLIEGAGEGAVFSDEGQSLFRVSTAAKRKFIGSGPMNISKDKFECAGLAFPLRDITGFAIVGQMTLLFGAVGGAQYEIRSPYPRSALKYLEAFKALNERNNIFLSAKER